MLIAVPNCQGRVSPVFDVAARLMLVRLRGEAEVERKEVVLVTLYHLPQPGKPLLKP